MTPEDLFKNSFDGYRQDPPPGAWKGINRRLATRDFFTPGLKHFNILYVAAAAAAVVAVLWLSPDTKQPLSNDTPNVTVSDSATDININSGGAQEPSYNENQTKTYTITTPRQNEDVPLETELKADTFVDTQTPTSIDTDTGVAATSSEAEIQSTTLSQQPMPCFTSAFHASEHAGCAPLTVYLHNLSQNTEYTQWNLGNGETSYEQDLYVTYDKPGTYIIALRSVCGTYAKTSYDTIRVSAKRQAEIAVAIAGLTITAEARNTGDASIVWDFGDYTQQSGKRRTHTYQQPGVYDITLIVSDKICSDTIHKSITIKEPEYSLTFPNAIVASRSGAFAGNYNAASPDNKALFGPKGDVDAVSEYSLIIYTRAGKQVFATNNPRDTWNGYYLDELLPRGVYVYKCRCKFVNGETSSVNGNITLLWE
ncbi:MAG: PKD domain-containing protein [Bacteroidales bacterium]|nr:PKD domain-containing protein [Bacteroidales bacterium]